MKKENYRHTSGSGAARAYYEKRAEDRPVQVWFTAEGKVGGTLAPAGNVHIVGAVPHKVLFKTVLSAA